MSCEINMGYAHITVVSGLPRSGTSALMQMLSAGGMRVVSDNKRLPDQWNPVGYYEYEPVRRIAKDANWLRDVRGAAIKIVAPLLVYLPKQYCYNVLFVVRNVKATLASQLRMMNFKGGAPVRTLTLYDLEECLLEMKDFVATQLNMHTLFVHYEAVCRNPRGQAALVRSFLRCPLNLEAMAATVQFSKIL